MDLSVVNHEDYFAKIGDDHKFPINKFGELAKYLIEKKIVKKFHQPYACSEETLKRVHSEKYIKDVKNKTLDQNTIKKISLLQFQARLIGNYIHFSARLWAFTRTNCFQFTILIT